MHQDCFRLLDWYGACVHSVTCPTPVISWFWGRMWPNGCGRGWSCPTLISPDHAGHHAREARIGREDRPRPAFDAHRGLGDEVERDRACGARPRARLVPPRPPWPDGGCGRGGGSRRRCTDVIVNRAARRDHDEVRDESPLSASRRKEALAMLLLGVFWSVMERRVSKAAFVTPGAPHQQGAYGDGDGWSESGVADRDSRR